MKIKFRRLIESAQPLARAHEGDACFDLVAVNCKHVDQDHASYYEYGTGLALEIPHGYVGLVFPRSSVSHTGGLLCNSVGVIDSGYRGEVKLRFKGERPPYQPGDRVGQLMVLPLPHIEFEEAEELVTSTRGTGGFGSTGK